MKRILITGINSYVGNSFESYLSQWHDEYKIDKISLRGDGWRKNKFSDYDVIYHVAGIAHSDRGAICSERTALYYQINTELTIEVAKKAKEDGVKQFIFMSSSIVYGESSPVGQRKMITRDTPVSPVNSYGDSKVKAEKGLLALESENFKIVIIRSPMIYGRGSKGNFPILSKMAKKMPLFPVVENKRSMIYIENLMEFVRLMVENEESGVFWPQNKEYSQTSELVRLIAKVHGKRILMIKGFTWALHIMGKFTVMVNKAFGGLCYAQELSQYKQEYQKISLIDSIKITEGIKEHVNQMNILVVCQYYYPEPFRITDICEALVKQGHSVTVVTGTPNYPEGIIYKGYEKGLCKNETIHGVKVHRCSLIPRRKNVVNRFLNYYSFVFFSWMYVRTLKEDFDVVFVNQLSPVMMAEAGISWANRNGKNCVLYCLDLWPESLLMGGVKKGSLIYRVIMKTAKRIYSNCDDILVSSHAFLDYFAKVLKMDTKNVRYLPQYAEDMFAELPVVKKKADTVNFLLAGNIGIAQSVETIVEAARYLKDDKEIHIHIVGSGVSLERCKKMAEGLNNITFYGRHSLSEMPQFYAMADVMLVSLVKDPGLSVNLPGKVQSYLAAGKPVVGSIDGETARVIQEAKCGLCAPAEDAVALAKIMRTISMESDKLAEYGTNARRYYTENFCKEHFIAELIHVLRGNCKD